MIISAHQLSHERGVLARVKVVVCMAIMLITILPASLAEAVLQVGENAPLFTLPDSTGHVLYLDKKTSEPVLLVFVSSHDRYTSSALDALNDMFKKHPILEQGLRRWIILSGADAARHVEQIKAIAGSAWPILIDAQNEVHRTYKIIATPTVVVVGKQRRVEAVNPGYDLGMEDALRKALAQALSVKLPEAVLKQPPKPNMMLQLGRRMAARGLWEHALRYYIKAMEQEPLSPDAQLELAEIYLEMERPEDALKILNEIPTDSPAAERVGPLRKRIQALKERGAETPKPPEITR
jgi:tetratricopeptide (TPR) repeat protein